MVQSRLSGSGGAKSVIGALAALKANQRASSLFSRLAVVTSDSEIGRPMLERLCTQDAAWSSMTCAALTAGAFSEPGLTYGSIGQAVDVLGLPTTLFALTATNAFLIFKELEKKAPVSAKNLIRQAVATGTGAAVLGRVRGLSDAVSSRAGLVHNIGLAVSAYAFSSDYKFIQEVVAASAGPLEEIESELLGFKHTDVARTVLSQFGFANHIVQAAVEHHDPLKDVEPLVQAVAVAATISHQLGCSEGLGTAAKDIPEKELASIGFDAQALELAVVGVSEGLARLGRSAFE